MFRADGQIIIIVDYPQNMEYIHKHLYHVLKSYRGISRACFGKESKNIATVPPFGIPGKLNRDIDLTAWIRATYVIFSSRATHGIEETDAHEPFNGPRKKKQLEGPVEE